MYFLDSTEANVGIRADGGNTYRTYTSLEVAVRRELRRCGLRFRANVMSLPGRPDVVFTSARLIVFIDGDFWHGFRYPAWKRRLPPFWRLKIERNRARDVRNFAALRRRG